MPWLYISAVSCRQRLHPAAAVACSLSANKQETHKLKDAQHTARRRARQACTSVHFDMQSMRGSHCPRLHSSPDGMTFLTRGRGTEVV